MRLLSVAERELRAAARHKATYRTRWITAAVFFALLVWLIWALDGFRRRGAAPQIFNVFSGMIFFYCIIVGTARTADCLSSEKREGTLGLLFLTNLNSAEIIAGKLCSSALAAMYGLVAIFPMLAVLLLMGGITFSHFWHTVLALVNAIFFSVAAGFVASALCVRQFTAIALGTGLALAVGAGLMGVAAIVNSARGPKAWVDGLSAFCPLYTLISADGGRIFGPNHFWPSLAAVACVSWTWLGLVIWQLARTWRDRPQSASAWRRFKFWQRWQQRSSTGRAALRRRLLDINPFFWLGGRRRVSAPVFMLLMVVLVVITAYVTAPYFGRLFPAGAMKPLAGSWFAWLWTGLAVHALVLYYAAMVASQRLAEDKQSGALELILSTPTTERSISRGLWMAYARRMFFPALVAILVHCFFIWQGATILVLEPPSKLPAGITPGKLLWHVLLNKSFSGVQIGWEFGFMLKFLLLCLLMMAIVWLTLGWVGRWLGLRMKHPGFAPMVSLALVFVPPIILFSVFCYLCDTFRIFRMPERFLLPLILWVAFGTGAAHCLLMSVWAAGRLRRDFRTTVTSRFQPPSLRRWWLPSRRAVVRFTAGAIAGAAVVAMTVLLFYGYQNWRSKRAWAAFQKELKQTGQSLDLSAVLPGPVPDNANFARTPEFQTWLSHTNARTARLFDNLKRFETTDGSFGNPATAAEWIKQDFAPLADYAKWIGTNSNRNARTNRAVFAAGILQGLQSRSNAMRAVATAARAPFFQISTNRTALSVIQTPKEEISALERLHVLFQIRACALLAADRAPEAGDDFLTGLQFVRLARQAPDPASSIREQTMLARSLQPLWEGLAAHQWNETQLAAFQKELARFNLLSDHTNAIHRVVLANIEIWRAIPATKPGHVSVPVSGGFKEEPIWQTQPLAWWFDSCRQLYQAGQNAIGKVDVAGDRVRLEMDWSDLSGLPLDGFSSQLLQQNFWWGNNPALVGFAQSALNQAVIACALERFRLANGNYPATLEQLAPAYLDRIPNDVIRGRPMIYQNFGDGRYILRGVGPNETDDRKSVSSDDWLWSYPTNAPVATPQPQ